MNGPARQKFESAGGFSLIELLVVMLIVAVLAGLAYPAYTSHLKRSLRADARAELLRMQLAIEKQRVTSLAAKPTLPDHWTTASGVAKHYQFGLEPGGGQDYAITARALPGDGQNEDRQGDTPCAALTLRSQGLDTRYEPAVCWH